MKASGKSLVAPWLLLITASGARAAAFSGSLYPAHPFLHFDLRAFVAPVLFAKTGISLCAKLDHCPTPGAPRRLILGWVLQRREVVFIGSVPDVHFRHEGFPALGAILPVTRMALIVMECTEGVPTVVPITTVARVGKDHVLMFVIANPVPATVSLG